MIYKSTFGFPTWNFKRAFEEFDRMRRQMDRFAGGLQSNATDYQKPGVFPALNLSEDAHNYFIRAELPGIDADELDIQAVGKNLTISGERKIVPEAEGTRYHRREREAGKFSRVISLPGDIEATRIEAKLSNGILAIMIPKAEETKPRKISIT